MGLGYKFYSVLVSQSGTDHPVVKDLDNTLGRVKLERTGVGTYTFTSDNKFKTDKTIPFKDAYTDIDGNYMTLEWVDTSTMTLKTYAAVDVETLADGVLTNQSVYIRVYL